MKKRFINSSVFAALILVLLLNACVSSKKLRYFTNVPESGETDVLKITNQNLILPSDILYITIFSSDDVTNRILNSAGSIPGSSTGTAAGPSATPTGGGAGSEYLVSDSGYIKLAVIGELKVKGMKKEALADTIANILTRMKYVIDPMVTVRIVNFKVTILGEVNKPGVISVPNEHVNVTELIALAGDLTIFGNRHNILLIRETNGKRVYKRFDLSRIDMFNSDIFNLQNHDIIYIEPTKDKAASIDRSPQFYSILVSTLSLMILVYTQIGK
jgi:polysaccharide export outer membrane protein